MQFLLSLTASLDSLPQFAQASAEEILLILDLIWPVRINPRATSSDTPFSRLHENLDELRVVHVGIESLSSEESLLI